VVAALHVLAEHLAMVQRQAAVAAAIFQRSNGACRRAVEQHRLAEDGASQKRAGGELIGPGADVPAVLQKHGPPPHLESERAGCEA